MSNAATKRKKYSLSFTLKGNKKLINRRKTYLINPPFQLKFSMLVTFLVFLSSLIYPWAIFDLMNETIQIFAKVAPSFAPILEQRKKTLWIILTMWEVGFLGMIFAITIFFSHKVAGPLYRLKVYLIELKKGKSHQEITLREGDYFKEIITEVQKTFEYLSAEYNKDYIPLTEAIRQLTNLKTQSPEEKRESFDKILEKLTEIQYRLKRR